MPINLELISKLFFFSFTLWLGTYLLARNFKKPAIMLTGLGLFAYSLALVIELLTGQLITIILLLPAALWIGAALHLFPEEIAWRGRLIQIWALTTIPVLILALLNPWFGIIIVIANLLSAGMVGKYALRSRFKNTLAILAVVALFFTLSTGLIALPFDFLPRSWGILALGLDLLVLGLLITAWDAFDEGESMRAHLVRSFVAAFYYAGALAALVIIFIVIDGDLSFAKLLLLTSIIEFGILTQTYSAQIQSLLDRLTFTRSSTLSIDREILRTTADGLPRLSTLKPADVDEAEFTRLTRRAISNLGNLPKLATSPLTKLPAVLSQSGDNPLDRAHALKALLTESIGRLKPKGETDFGSTDEWRYFNALYFPYVIGIKPHSRRIYKDFLDETSILALDWFQSSVPERTLHNWQNAAARLVAQDLLNIN
ncbi:MAG: hypothetical protein H8E29_06055 [Anaerolineales bacterium]|uniref:Uncharacterized protein n=1 Tax=Candidatus Desulfolinea nitratireducens TaxID=2841698 RepID=A0A8J6NLJ6_9CHLR|nr:hypothetical protein [Candidatus Desulfolinea nitratireducens]